MGSREVHRWDGTATGQWERVKSLSEAVSGHGSAVLNGKMCVSNEDALMDRTTQTPPHAGTYQVAGVEAGCPPER
jgi:hypothetical protein